MATTVTAQRCERAVAGRRAAAGQPALRPLRLAAGDRRPGRSSSSTWPPSPAALEDPVTGDVLAVLGARGVIALLRDLRLPALPAVRRRARGGRARPADRAATSAGASCVSFPPTGRPHAARDLPGDRRRFSEDWWRYYFFLQLYSTGDARRGHPGRLDALRRGRLLPGLACSGPSRSGSPERAGPRSWLRVEFAALAPARWNGVSRWPRIARLVSDIVGASLLGQSAGLRSEWGWPWRASSPAPDRPKRPRRAPRGRPSGPLLAGSGPPSSALHSASAGWPARHRPSAEHAAAGGRDACCDRADWPLGGLLVLPAVFGRTPAGCPRVLAARPLLWLGLISYGSFSGT